MHDKLAALDALARHLGMYERDNSQKSITLVLSKDDMMVL
jgi:hypothetical protein